jgi:hypothetical protein
VPQVNSDVERWFVRRGVPHFIDDYAATTDIWTRALPLLVLASIAGGFNALNLNAWSWQRNVAASVVIVAVWMAGWSMTNVLRRRSAFARPREVGTPELATLLLAPVVPSLIFQQWGDALQTIIEGFVVVGAIYLVTSYGVVPLSSWAVGRSVRMLVPLAQMVARALPLLLLFTTFLFINAEVWQVAGTLVGPAYVATLAIFFVLGALFVLSRIPALMSSLAQFDDWGEVVSLVHSTPAEAFTLPAEGDPDERPLSRRQKVNIGLVSVFSQALQVTFVAVLLTGFFTLFGLLAIPEETAAAWTGLERVHVLLEWTWGGQRLVVTEPLVRVAGFLGAFTGMYFTVVLTTDATYRDEFAEDVGPQIRQALAVRTAYRHHLDNG